MKANYKAGKNIAMKVPPHEYESTVSFYRNVLELDELTPNTPDATPCFEFGDKVLWIDCVKGCSQAEIWLEICTDDPKLAAEHLRHEKIDRCDDIEPLPEGFNGFWISSPCNIVHLITGDESA